MKMLQWNKDFESVNLKRIIEVTTQYKDKRIFVKKESRYFEVSKVIYITKLKGTIVEELARQQLLLFSIAAPPLNGNCMIYMNKYYKGANSNGIYNYRI